MEYKKADEVVAQPVSPIGQYFSSSVLSISILAVLESEVPVDDLPAISLLKDIFLPINPRFSSIMVADKNGVKHWKSVEVNLKNHVHVPNFPVGMSQQFYDKCLQDYLSKLSAEEMPQSQPLWEVHIVKYPTSNAAGSVIFKLHHALGDGFSLMGALLSCLQRADDPSRPLTFPSVRMRPDINGSSIFKNVPKFFNTVFNTASDFCWSMIKSSLIEDDKTPIRSGSAAAGWLPITITTMTFPLHQISQIKDNLGATLNDVITGTIFLGTRLYMQAVNQESTNLHSTAVVLLNTRMLKSISSVKEMVKPDSKAPWGNHFAFLHVSVPQLTNAEIQNPLKFIRKAQEIIQSKRSSFGAYLTAKLLETVKKFRGHETAAKFIHGSLNNSSIAITNMMGPVEKMTLANHAIKGLYFMVVGSPQSLVVTIVSYMGNLRVSLGAEEGFIDSPKLKSCIENAFEMILNAASATPSNANFLNGHNTSSGP
ncbi:diacylglycerol O-acyltransferase [Citrus sinensis]|nr:diacylglycerol O-acyltransferase [Citrus sinensis]